MDHLRIDVAVAILQKSVKLKFFMVFLVYEIDNFYK